MKDSIRVSELRQFAYCPRVVYLNRELADRRAVSGQMSLGMDAESERLRLEKRRNLARYGLSGYAKKPQFFVESQELNMHGVIDLCLVDPSGSKSPRAIPVEFKLTYGLGQAHQVVQLAAYALCLEESYGPVPFGFLVSLMSGQVTQIQLAEPKAKVPGLLAKVRALLEEPVMPPAVKERAKCQACELKRFCNDVW